MATNVDRSCSQCRRAGEKLFLKGDRCFGPKCAIVRRNYPPGAHGPDSRHSKGSGFGRQLAEKQKAKRTYGLLERQFANYVTEASKKTGDTGKFLVGYLESRLDNVVYRAGFAKSRAAARQLVSHGNITVNDKKVDIASYRVRVGDVVALRERAKQRTGFAGLSEALQKVEPPVWLSLDVPKVSAKMLNAATLDNPSFDARLIVEFYSR